MDCDKCPLQGQDCDDLKGLKTYTRVADLFNKHQELSWCPLVIGSVHALHQADALLKASGAYLKSEK